MTILKIPLTRTHFGAQYATEFSTNFVDKSVCEWGLRKFFYLIKITCFGS